jgi:diguanylate cyclase (GGDEF)-like protein
MERTSLSDVSAVVNTATLDAMGLPVLALAVDGSVEHANISWIASFGAPGADAWSWLETFGAGEREHVRRTVHAAVDQCRSADFEASPTRLDGSAAVLEGTIRMVEVEPGVAAGVLLVGVDVTERRTEEERLAYIAGHDALTGLANRRTFDEALQRAVSRANRGARSVVLMIDMDYLKAFNDEFGHPAGDQALVNLSMLLRAHVRATDVPARRGGDEFAVLLEDATVDEALDIAERMRQVACTEEFVAGARQTSLGISGGLASIEPGVSAATLLDRVDAALYLAKCGGRNRIVVWSEEAHGHPVSEEMSIRLREAFSAESLFLMYQPVVSLRDGHIAHCESLVRLRDNDGTVYNADAFIGLAERLGLSGRLTRFVVGRVVSQLSDTADISISVNLSAGDLGDGRTLDAVEEILTRAPGGVASRLRFEIRERAVLENLVGARRWIDRLGALGCPFLVDDFGSSASFFTLLHEDAVSEVKLSRHVVKAMAACELTHGFVRSLRELIEGHGKSAVAAYLDTQELVDGAIEAGFELGQGFQVREPVENLASLADFVAPSTR